MYRTKTFSSVSNSNFRLHILMSHQMAVMFSCDEFFYVPIQKCAMANNIRRLPFCTWFSSRNDAFSVSSLNRLVMRCVTSTSVLWALGSGSRRRHGAGHRQRRTFEAGRDGFNCTANKSTSRQHRLPLLEANVLTARVSGASQVATAWSLYCYSDSIQ